MILRTKYNTGLKTYYDVPKAARLRNRLKELRATIERDGGTLKDSGLYFYMLTEVSMFNRPRRVK